MRFTTLLIFLVDEAFGSISLGGNPPPYMGPLMGRTPAYPRVPGMCCTIS